MGDCKGPQTRAEGVTLNIFNARLLFALPLFALLYFSWLFFCVCCHFYLGWLSLVPGSVERLKGHLFFSVYWGTWIFFSCSPGENISGHLFFALCFIFVQGQQYFMHCVMALILFVHFFILKPLPESEISRDVMFREIIFIHFLIKFLERFPGNTPTAFHF